MERTTFFTGCASKTAAYCVVRIPPSRVLLPCKRKGWICCAGYALESIHGTTRPSNERKRRSIISNSTILHRCLNERYAGKKKTLQYSFLIDGPYYYSLTVYCYKKVQTSQTYTVFVHNILFFCTRQTHTGLVSIRLLRKRVRETTQKKMLEQPYSEESVALSDLVKRISRLEQSLVQEPVCKPDCCNCRGHRWQDWKVANNMKAPLQYRVRSCAACEREERWDCHDVHHSGREGEQDDGWKTVYGGRSDPPRSLS